MQIPKFLIIVVTLYIFSIPFNTTALADDQADPAATAIVNTLYQIKNLLIKRSSPSDIEEMIKQSRNKGATGYKFDRYSGDKTGWSLFDSKGREVLRVIFSFVGHRATEGKYFGPLMSFNDSKEVHKWHRDIMSTYYKQIGIDKYYLEDNCTASMELFQGSTGLGRSIITVVCQ